jgi:hypothetical protein
MNVLQALKSERDRLQKDVNRLNAAIDALGGSANTGRTAAAANRRPTLSAAARARIAAAQRARWAKVKAGGAKKQNVVNMPKRKQLSAAARQRIAAAQRARWAKIRARKS